MKIKNKILVVGLPFDNIDSDPINTLIGNRVRTWVIYSYLKKMGLDTYLYVDKDILIDKKIYEENSDNFLQDITSTLEKINNHHFDYIILCSTKLQYLFEVHPWIKKIKTKNMIGAFCYHGTPIKFYIKKYQYYRKFKAIFFVTPIQSLIWNKISNIPSFQLTTGQTGQIQRVNQIEKKVIFIGEFRDPKKFLLLVDIAKELKDYTFYIITGRIIDKNNSNQLVQYIKEEKDVLTLQNYLKVEFPENLIIKNIPYGKENEILNSVTIGLDFSWSYKQEIENSKVARYLTYGLYPIVELPAPSFRHIYRFKYGAVVDYNASVKDWVKAIKESERKITLTTINQVRNSAKIYYSWENVGNEVLSVILALNITNTNALITKFLKLFKINK